METLESLTPEKELELINSYAPTPLKPEEIFTFNLTLCDNEVDRDFDAFSNEALEKMCELFPGKTGISDHSLRARDQRARLYFCYTERPIGKKNSLGQDYVSLKAKAYMLRTPGNAELIKEIQGGIKKEVSVSCSMEKSICSICGKDTRESLCRHTKGKTYQGKLCYAVLQNPLDAYEWSFVAVPAQVNAGVSKAFRYKEEYDTKNRDAMKTVDLIKSADKEIHMTKSQALELAGYIDRLEEKAKAADAYKSSLLEDISRYALIIMPAVSSEEFKISCSTMNIGALKKFRDDMEKQARQVLPLQSQLRACAAVKSDSNKSFII